MTKPLPGKNRQKDVALLIETSNAYSRGLLEGIAAWQREHELWSIYLPEQDRTAKPPSWLPHWKGDGVIVRIETEETAKAILRVNVPAVDVSAARLVPDVPWVETDDHKIAQLAVEHLMSRGFRNLAFCGEEPFNWSKWREEHVVKLAGEAGLSCQVFRSRSRFDANYSWNRERNRLKQWLQQLPYPIGIVACYDMKGQQVLDACRQLDIAVPEQVAVLAVDNDTTICELCIPPLTSIVPDSRQAGYEAAALLDSMMRGQVIQTSMLRIAPLGVVERLSTDTVAVEDTIVRGAMQFIRQQAYAGINVSDVVRAVGVTRRVLESHFQRVLGRTPHGEIERIRMNRIKILLRETDLSIESVAMRTGFSHPDYLSVAFKRVTGMTPGQYRGKS
jgi:LacI family transcriptional regulator